MDECAARMSFFGRRNFTVPRSELQSREFCRELKEAINCYEESARDCLEEWTYSFTMLMLERSESQQRYICQNYAAREDLRKVISCISDQRAGELHDAVANLIVRLEYVNYSGHVEAPHSKMRGICCSLRLFESDVDRVMNESCANNPMAGRFVHSLVPGSVSLPFSLTCNDNNDILPDDECQASSSSPSSGWLRELRELPTRKVRHKSVVLVLLKIVESVEKFFISAANSNDN